MQTVELWQVEDGLIVGDDQGVVRLVGTDPTFYHDQKDGMPYAIYTDKDGNTITSGVGKLHVTDVTVDRIEYLRPDTPDGFIRTAVSVAPFELPNGWVVRAAYLDGADLWVRKGNPVQKQDERAFIEGR